MSFNSVWNITKSAVLIGAIVFAYLKFDTIMSKFGTTKPQKPEVVTIEDNALLARFEANEKRLKELEKELKEKNSLILEYAKQNKEQIDEIGVIRAKLNQTVKLHQESQHTYLKGGLHDNYFVKIYKTASDGEKFPVAWAMFYPNQPDNNKWKTGTYPLEFNLDIVETENNDGIYNRYAELNIENNQMKETKGNSYPVKITRLDWAKHEKKTKSFSLNPRLGLAMQITTNAIAPALDFSLASYGKTKADMDWRFGEFSLGANSDELLFGFTPFSWNFGKPVPLLENAFIGPSVAFSTDDGMSFGVKFSVPF